MSTAPWGRLIRALLLATALLFTAGYASVGLVLLLAVGVAEAAATRRVPWERSSLDLPLVAFVAAFLLSGIASPYRAIATGSAVLSALTLWAGFGPLYRSLRATPEFVRPLLWAWVTGGLLAALWAVGTSRATSQPAALPALAQNSLGTTLLVAFVLGLGLAVSSGGTGRLWALLTAGATVMAMVLTFSRGAWVGACAAVLVLAALSRWRLLGVATAVVAAGLAVATATVPLSAHHLMRRAAAAFSLAANEDRVILARAALAIFRDHPALGTGMNTFWIVHPHYLTPDPVPRAFAHNVFLNMAAEGGLLGAGAFVAVLVGVLAAGWRWHRSQVSPDGRVLSAAVLAAFVGVLVREQFDGTIMSVSVAAGFWMLAAVQAALSDPRIQTTATPAPASGTRPAVLVVSNGHGEDAVGMALARALGPEVAVTAYPLVGVGTAYRGVPLLDPRRVLPSGGFGFRSYLPGLLADLRAGVLRLWWQQRRTLQACRGNFDAVVAVGDCYCLWMAGHAGRPVVYVATAKSEYGEPHRWLELGVMRRLAAVVFARDERTAAALAARGIPARHVGNPLMDTVDPDGPDLRPHPDRPTVLLLPGSRQDAYVNMQTLLAVAHRVAENAAVTFLCAVAPSVDLDRVRAVAARSGWEAGEDVLRSGETTVQLTRAFGAAVRAADVVVGLAGTANEQAAGLGRPVVAFPGPGHQFTRQFLALQQRILGEAVVATRSWEEAAEATVRLLRDPAERARRGDAGRRRMGGPGAVQAIAAEVRARLRSARPSVRSS